MSFKNGKPNSIYQLGIKVFEPGKAIMKFSKLEYQKDTVGNYA